MGILEERDEKVTDTHPLYDQFIDRWVFWFKAYEGDKAFVEHVLKKHSRESIKNHEKRLNNAEVFNYCKSIIGLYSHFMSMQQADRQLDKIRDNESFNAFWRDVDFYGTDYDIFFKKAGELSYVAGFVGILVDKPQVTLDTQKQESDRGIYPYYSLYTPSNIKDWEWSTDPTSGRPILTFLKLKQSSSRYLIWTTTEWQEYLEEGNSGKFIEGNRAPHALNKIPFTWMTNGTNMMIPYFGESDIKTASRIQASVTRTLSNGDEVVEYAAFPMLLKAMVSSKEENPPDDEVGVKAVQEFDPENPDSKTSWLESKVGEPIDAMLSWIQSKTDHVFKESYLSSIAGMSGSNEAKSGLALKYEFRQLTAVLSSKGRDMDEAEMSTLSDWMLWMQIEGSEDIKVKRPSSVNIDDVMSVLENYSFANAMVKSDSFRKIVQKKVVKATLPDERKETIEEIDKEIDSSSTDEPFKDEDV